MRSEFKTPFLNGLTLAGAVVVLVGGASLAMGQAESIDSDGDGLVSFTELLALMPALTEEEYQALDTDADGLLSADEIGAAQDAGLIPAG